MKNIHIGIVCIVIAAAAFFGGMKYGQAQAPAADQTAFAAGGGFRGGRMGQGGGGMRGAGFGAGGGFTTGEVISKDDKSITVKLRTGGSKIILISPSTQYKKTTDGALADIAVGKQVMVTGQGNSDGSITAEQVQLRPDEPTQQPAPTN